ncbi:hypothetical protein F2P79_014090 [Pimephales promelas]|nr:hypothetical protein F2P79_014090 [Pimephales promelas]
MDCLYLRKKALLLDVFVVFILHVNTNTQGEFKVMPPNVLSLEFREGLFINFEKKENTESACSVYSISLVVTEPQSPEE